MDSDKLLPCGKCFWLVPILQVAPHFSFSSPHAPHTSRFQTLQLGYARRKGKERERERERERSLLTIK